VSIRNNGVSTPKVVRAWEDFMWFKVRWLLLLSLHTLTCVLLLQLKTLPKNENTLDDELQKIQQLFDQAPPSHYNKGKNPLAFLQILLLSQQFPRVSRKMNDVLVMIES